MKSHIVISMALALPFVNAGYFAGKTSSENTKRATKYLKFFKTSSQLLGSGSTTSARYIQSPTAHFQAGGHAPPMYSSIHHYRYGGESSPSGGMMASASERSPSRIIIVRSGQAAQGSAKKSAPATQTYSSTVPYMPQASTAYPSYGGYPSYGYGHQAMSPYGYQMPQMLQMAASAYAPQMSASPGGYSTAGQFGHGQSPLVASMIAAAQRVTQGQNAYGSQYGASSYMSPQYSPYGYGGAGAASSTNPYYSGYGYSG